MSGFLSQELQPQWGCQVLGSPPWEKKHRSISMGWGTALILYPVLGEGMSMIAFLCYF